MKSAPRHVAAVGLLLAAACGLLSHAVCHWLAPFGATIQPLKMRGEWIAAANDQGNYAACFRKTFQTHANVRNAWLAISACDAFEVSVNGDTVAHQFLWRPTRPFQNGLSEEGEKVGFTLPAMGLNYPREYQWSGHRNYLLPVFVDLTPFIRPGRNVICVEVETRTLPARMIVDGEALLETGETIALQSDPTWKAAPVPPDGSSSSWVTTAYSDRDWAAAAPTPAPPGKLLRTFNPRVFTQPFSAPWLHAAENAPAVFEQTWSLASAPRDAWLRIAANRNYDLFINDRRVNVAIKPNLDGGEWIIDTQKASDLPMLPELLDPDEAGTLFVGSEFASAPHSDPTSGDFHPFVDTENRTRERPNASAPDLVPGDLDAIKEHGRAYQPFSSSTYAPAALVPKALSRNRQLGAFNLYDVRWMLRRGANKISVRLTPAATVAPMNWTGQFAIDGEALTAGGVRQPLSSTAGWTSAAQNPDGTMRPARAAIVAAPMVERALPPRSFRGVMFDGTEKLRAWSIIGIFVTLLTLGSAAAWMWRWRSDARCLGATAILLLVPVTVLLAALLVQASWGERDEMLYFRQAATWGAIVALALALTAVTALRLGARAEDRLARSGRGASAWLRRFPHTAGWKFVLVWLLLLCTFLRAYRLDFQPLDDDEYASVQAVLAIADHGVPKFTEDVFYTRSPVYHYLTAAVVKVFGANLWALRLPSVAFGVATGWLLYLCGARLLRRRWVGLGALALFAVHPYAIFSSHIARFYQQQQFFALLAIYWFCRGMVTGQSMRHRYLMLAALLGAILSQELSALLILPIAAGYILFAERNPWPDEARFLTAAACVIALVALDLLVFQTRCLTRTEGVSPNVEPTLKPNFFYPMNFFMMFLAYSRLHLVLSVLFTLGFPLALRRRNRTVAALYFLFFAGLLFTIFFVTSASLRYQYWLLPLWLLLGLYGTSALLKTLARSLPATPQRHRWVTPALAAGLFVAVLLSLAPWRIIGSYDAKLLPDSTTAFRYVQSQLRAGDAVAATEPHPHAALLETGRVDYDLSVPLLQDFVYEKDGRLIDRNGGAPVISDLSELQRACASRERLWVVVNREKFRSRGRNIRWEYPGARVELFLRENLQLKFRASLWSVYLWDVNAGQYRNFREDRSAF